ncbi:hypothetical protein IC617_08185 [Neiella sp. HB171785]|uniref:Uncharacterized protein n=1 Tax=Neiella litorisoli TaxID=2771431 RepID=A0A8J6UPT2_9GAMM|nr:hypothetical protein [Neiella litorisoli]MBD1389402.1 hypothetical protein [Neiella litorisoli]
MNRTTPYIDSPFPTFFEVPSHQTKSALVLKPVKTQKDGWHSVQFSGAWPKQGTREYDWKNDKAHLHLQIGRFEHQELLAVMVGYIEQCEFTFHGSNRNKSLSLNRQGSAISIKLSGPAFAITQTLGTAVSNQMADLVAYQYALNYPGMSIDAALLSAKRFGYWHKRS